MLEWLDAHGAGEGFRAPEFAEQTYTNTAEGIRHVGQLLNGFVGAHDSEWLFHEAQRIRRGQRSGPCRADRCKNLHHQRDQQDREISVQPLPHQATKVQRFSLSPLHR